MNIFSKRLKYLREARKVTLQEMEKELSVTNSCISKWENGKRDPKLQNVIALAKYFNVSVAYLVGEIDKFN